MHVKRLISWFCVLVLLFASACAPQPDPVLDPKNPVTVTLWHYYVGENQQALEAKVQEFNQTLGIENGVIVEAVAMGSIAELEEAVTNSAMGTLNASPMPDLFSSYPDKAMEINTLDKVCDLSEYFSEEEKALYIEDFLADGIFAENEILLLPIVKSTELLYINKTEWDAFCGASGFDEQALITWEGIYDAARAYYQWHDSQTPDVPWDGKGLIGLDSVANYVIIGNKQLGVNVIDAEGEQAVLHKAALKRIFDLYYKSMCLGYFDAVGKFRSDDIKAGDLITYVGSSSSAAYFPTWIEENNTQKDIDFLAMPYPVFEGGTSYAIQQGAGMCVVKSSPGKQAGAVMFLKWFTEPAQNIGFAMTTGYLPVQKASYNNKLFESVLESLRAGSKAEENVAAVYDIALRQITEANTYAAKPFTGSYDVRSILQSTLLDSAAMGKEIATGMQEQGKSEEEILQELDIDAQFESWVAAIQSRLDELEIAYTVA